MQVALISKSCFYFKCSGDAPLHQLQTSHEHLWKQRLSWHQDDSCVNKDWKAKNLTNSAPQKYKALQCLYCSVWL